MSGEKKTNAAVQPELAIATEYCSVISRQQKEDPIGTAPHHQRHLFVEVPLPWEPQVAESRHFPAGLEEVLARCAESVKFRFQAYYSDTMRSPEDHVRVFYFWHPTFPCAKYNKKEYIVPRERLNDLVEALLLETERLADFDEALQPTGHIRELFVCTHGSHDRCCGTFGFPLYEYMNEQYGGAARKGDVSRVKIRVWRTSHFSGHRLAPTFIDFPEGRYWAYADRAMLQKLLRREGEAADMARHYRGWGMIGKMEQVAERKLFSRFGWEWIDYEKHSEVIDSDGESARVRIRYRSPAGESGEYVAEVRIAGKVRVGGCGKEWSEANQYTIHPLADSAAE